MSKTRGLEPSEPGPEADRIVRQVLTGDLDARQRHLALVRLELLLHGTRCEFDLAGPTVARIERERVERTTRAVMAQLTHRAASARERSSRRLRYRVAVATLAAGLLLALWLGTRGPRPLPLTGGDCEDALAAAQIARLAVLSGTVETKTGRRLQVIESGGRTVRSLCFSPDGKLLVTATNKGGVAISDVSPARADKPGLDL